MDSLRNCQASKTLVSMTTEEFNFFLDNFELESRCCKSFDDDIYGYLYLSFDVKTKTGELFSFELGEFKCFFNNSFGEQLVGIKLDPTNKEDLLCIIRMDMIYSKIIKLMDEKNVFSRHDRFKCIDACKPLIEWNPRSPMGMLWIPYENTMEHGKEIVASLKICISSIFTQSTTHKMTEPIIRLNICRYVSKFCPIDSPSDVLK